MLQGNDPIWSSLFDWANSLRPLDGDRWQVLRKLQLCYDGGGLYLDLDDCELLELPVALFSLTQLRVLTCARNAMMVIPDEIGQLAELQNFDCSSCNIDELPASIGRLTKLTTLSIDNNLMHSVPVELINLSQLVVFNCDANFLPPVIAVLSTGASTYDPSAESRMWVPGTLHDNLVNAICSLMPPLDTCTSPTEPIAMPQI